ncbi:Sphingosine kinase 1, partial [Coemansia erecta]
KDSNVLIFVNPVSGKRKSVKLFETIVKPILEIGCTQYTLQITKSQGHAAEYVKTEDLSKFTSIVAVSGDGLLHEILNGLLTRPDWPSLRNIALGVVPTGTGNGLAKTIDCIWPEQAAVAIVRAQSRPIDIMSATMSSGLVEYCFLSLTWGLLGDIDIESERMRWAGAARLDLYGTLRLMNLRYYGGRLHYLPATVTADGDDAVDGDDANSQSEHDREVNRKAEALARKAVMVQESAQASSINISESNNQGKDMAWGLPAPNFSSPLVRQSPKPLPDALSPPIQPAVTLHPTLTAGIQLPVKPGTLSSRWRTIEGPFVQLIATNVAWLSADFLACQRARVSDGAIDLVYSGNASKWNMFQYMSSSSSSNYMNTEDITHVRARAFILEPTGLRTTSRNKTSLDALQPAKKNQLLKAGGRPTSMPIFNSLRSKVQGSRLKKTVSPQAPVPARVRSQAYTSYHQQTIGRDNSLNLQGLSVEAETSMPRQPAQAVLRSTADKAEPVAALPTAALPATAQHLRIQELADAAESSELSDKQRSGSSVDLGRAAATAEPADDESECRLVGEHGIVVLDGEQVELGPIKVECLPSLVSIISPPWLNESQIARVSSMPAPKIAQSIRGTLSREGS